MIWRALSHARQAPCRDGRGRLIHTADAATGQVALGGYPPRAPTDPDLQISSIRFVRDGFAS
jgi:hypothetical protein